MFRKVAMQTMNPFAEVVLRGALPAVASMWNIIFYDVSHNLLTGTVPQGVGSQPEFRVFMSAGVQPIPCHMQHIQTSPSLQPTNLQDLYLNDVFENKQKR
eukprot:2614137-Amphidinium_carterae.1